MAENQQRIEQFKKMADADPNNEIGHFSLGREYLAAGEFDAAVKSLRRVVELNPNIAKAYQLLGTALLRQERRDEAIAVLSDGIKMADLRGELMPRDEMIKSIHEIGAPLPELSARQAVAAAAGEGEVLCKRCGKIGKKLANPPFRNPFGMEIQEKICNPCWREAIGMGTKVINELRLPMSDPQAQKIWDQHIREFLHLV
jgi:tetratricopeptide (TPR) repeat protein